MQASDQSSTFPTMPQLTIPCLSRGDWGTQPIPVTLQLEKSAVQVSVLATYTAWSAWSKAQSCINPERHQSVHFEDEDEYGGQDS